MEPGETDNWFERLFHWIESHGIWSPLIFMSLYLVIVPLVLPGAPFSLGAGFMFGVIAGTIYVAVGTTAGAAIAFLLARYLFASRMAAHMKRKRPRVYAGLEAIAQEGWRFVLLTRLVPFFPFKLSNYAYGLTSISFRGFIVATFFGIIPITMINTYIGSLAGDLASLADGDVPPSKAEWIISIGGLITGVVLVVYITRIARRVLKSKIGESDLLQTQDGQGPNEE